MGCEEIPYCFFKLDNSWSSLSPKFGHVISEATNQGFWSIKHDDLIWNSEEILGSLITRLPFYLAQDKLVKLFPTKPLDFQGALNRLRFPFLFFYSLFLF